MAKKDKKDKKDNRVKTALFLEPRQVAALKAFQGTFPGINVSEHIRRAIDVYIGQMNEVAKKMPALPGAPQEGKK
jgi:hypothetical protein